MTPQMLDFFTQLAFGVLASFVCIFVGAILGVAGISFFLWLCRLLGLLRSEC